LTASAPRVERWSTKALAAGFNAHVSKPIQPAELLKTTTRLLKKKSETGQLKK